MPPSSVPRTAVFSFFADVTRWNTSCWAIDPIAIVAQAARNAIQSFSSAFGQNWSLPSRAAVSNTAPKPPAMPPSSHAM